MEWYQWIIILLGTGIVGGLARLIWTASKRDSKLDKALEEVSDNELKILNIEAKWKDHELGFWKKLGTSEGRINSVEKDLVEINANQKNLIHSINIQNKQVLDLIGRLEKTHESFINAQKTTNEKLADSIDAIKNTLINPQTVFHNQDIKDILAILSAKKR
jgi:predicted  nucleic acid-binding Zn-ribbon protein